MREIKRTYFWKQFHMRTAISVPQPFDSSGERDRSLMVDTSNNTERDWNILKGYGRCAWHRLPEELDIFITHEHPDHTGLVPKLLRPLEPGRS